MKTYYAVKLDGDFEDELFETEVEAEEYAAYLRSCAVQGSEDLHLSNPFEYDYDENAGDDLDIEIVEVDKDFNLV